MPLDALKVLKAVRRATQAAADAAEPSTVTLQGIADGLRPEVCERAAVFLVESEGKLQAAAHAPNGGEPSADDSGQRSAALDALERTASVAIGARAPAALEDQSGEAVPWTPVMDGGPPVACARVVAFPLLREGDPVGALALEARSGAPFTTQDWPLLTDVGERIAVSLENLRLRKELHAARRAKTDFLSVVNHELRTPLTAVVGYADLLEAGIPGPVTDKQRRHLVRIKESAWDLLELIDGILGYARYEGERAELNVKTVEPEVLLQDALRLVEGAATEKGLFLAVDAPPLLPAFPTDAEKARRILFHLLSNAVKFTPEGEVRVKIRSDSKWVCFSIADTGIGIPSTETRAIFEPFWQGERPETRTAGGAGMGLSLALKLAELLSGSIEVESEVNEGSTFTVRFPREGPRLPLL
jgi:signal transduction histidine kinase